MLRTSPAPWSVVLCLVCVWLMAATPALAQQRPLLTEDPDPVGEGKMLIEAGIDHTWTQLFPVSGLKGNLLRGPLLGISTGVGPSAELQLDGLSWSRLAIQERFDAPPAPMIDLTGDSTSSVEDIVVGTKLRLLRETARRPSFGFRFATRLPTAGDEKGIGLDTMDFFQSVLIGKSISSTRVVANLGWAILSDPTNGNSQNDVLSYGFSLAHRLGMLAVVADVNGWYSTRRGTPPPGTDTRGTATFGLRYPIGQARLDGGYYAGVTASDHRSGVKGGVTWTFDSLLGE
jgi:hypothetical protein